MAHLSEIVNIDHISRRDIFLWTLVEFFDFLIMTGLVLFSPFIMTIRVFTIASMAAMLLLFILLQRLSFKQEEILIFQGTMMVGLTQPMALLAFGVVMGTGNIPIAIFTIPLGAYSLYFSISIARRELFAFKIAEREMLAKKISKKMGKRAPSKPKVDPWQEKMQTLREKELEVEKKALKRLGMTMEDVFNRDE